MIEPSWLSDAQPDSPDLPLWTRAIVGEMVPDAVSPLGWTMMWQPCATQGVRDCLVRRFGFDDEELSSTHPETVANFGGHAYLNASTLRVWADRMPALDVDHIDPVLTAGSKPLPPHEGPVWSSPDNVITGMLHQWYEWVVKSRNQSELRSLMKRAGEATGAAVELDDLSDIALVERARDLQPLCRELFSQHINQTLAALVGPRLLNDACVAVGQPAHTLRLLSGIGHVDPVSPTLALWELSRLVRYSAALTRFFAQGPADLDRVLRLSNQPDAVALVAGIDALVEEVGFRGPNEWDLASPTWDVVPDILLALIGCMRHCDDSFAPQQRRQHLEADRFRLAIEIAAALHPEDRAIFVDAIESSAAFIRGREESRTAIMRVLHRMRIMLRELADRGVRRGDFADAGDLWMLTGDELTYYADGGLADVRRLSSERRREFEIDVDGDPPPTVWAAADPSSAEWVDANVESNFGDLGPQVLEPGDLMMGSPGSPGMAQGRARVIETDADLAQVRPGEVIVLARPVLAATPLFVAAGAVITDAGDTFTHAVVVARELGTPMVVGARGASERITTGALLNVDGLTGVVSVVPTEPLESEMSSLTPGLG